MAVPPGTRFPADLREFRPRPAPGGTPGAVRRLPTPPKALFESELFAPRALPAAAKWPKGCACRGAAASPASSSSSSLSSLASSARRSICSFASRDFAPCCCCAGGWFGCCIRSIGAASLALAPSLFSTAGAAGIPARSRIADGSSRPRASSTPSSISSAPGATRPFSASLYV